MLARITYLNIAVIFLGLTSTVDAATGAIAGVVRGYANHLYSTDAVNVNMQLLSTSDECDIEYECRTDINGWFCFSGIETGCYDLVAIRVGSFPDTIFSIEVVPDDTLLVYPILVLWPPYFDHLITGGPVIGLDNGVVSGTVRNTEGDPIEEVIITPCIAGSGAVDRQGCSGSDGSYSLLLPPGFYFLNYRVQGYYPERIDSITVVNVDTVHVDPILRPLHE